MLGGFKKSPDSLQLQVKRLRNEFLGRNAVIHSRKSAISNADFKIAVTMAECFDIEFRLPMIVGFLSLKCRHYTDDSVLDKIMEAINGKMQLQEAFSSLSIRSNSFPGSEGALHQPGFSDRLEKAPAHRPTLPETIAYEQLMDATHRRIRDWTMSNGSPSVVTLSNAKRENDTINDGTVPDVIGMTRTMI